MMNLLRFLCSLRLLLAAASSAQKAIDDDNSATIFHSSSPTVATSANPTDQPRTCKNYLDWHCYDCDSNVDEYIGCDDSRVGCFNYGNAGFASQFCCKCMSECQGQCNDTYYFSVPQPNDKYGHPSDEYDDYPDYSYYDDGMDDKGFPIVAFIPIGIIIAGAVCASFIKVDTRLTIMSARRQQQRLQGNNNNNTQQIMTTEERESTRHELFLTKFHLQTVLPDKSNITADSLRSLTTKQDEEQPDTDEDIGNDDASPVIGTAKSKEGSLPALSSWKKPSKRNECCICLECYNPGEAICVPITKECSHVFHQECILEWVKKNDKCPLCRVELL